jgi:release factor glutamine methyltransferase
MKGHESSIVPGLLKMNMKKVFCFLMKTVDPQEARWLLKEKYAGVTCPAYEEDVRRLEAGEPLAYVIGFVPFLGTQIYLDSNPLIPRVETEYWVEQAINVIKERNLGPVRILDLCAGSGAIGIALLRHLPDAEVDFAEIDRMHHMTILKNLEENHIDQRRAHVFGGDLFEKVTGTYDFILTNPPYLDPELQTRVEESVLVHEPGGALWGGRQGLALIGDIIRDAQGHLSRGGIIFIEHEPEQVEAIHESARLHGYRAFETIDDQYGIARLTALEA